MKTKLERYADAINDYRAHLAAEITRGQVQFEQLRIQVSGLVEQGKDTSEYAADLVAARTALKIYRDAWLTLKDLLDAAGADGPGEAL